MQRQHFTYIQILRFAAAIGVVLFHASGIAQKYIGGPIPSSAAVLHFGGFGVDLFFVISGFIIYQSTYSSTLSAVQFLRRRIERIVPLYWLATLAMVTFALLAPSAFQAHDWISPIRLLKSLFYMSFSNGEMPIVYVGWSLEFEMLFYLSSAALLFRGQKAWGDITVIFAAGVILGCGAARAGWTPGSLGFFMDPLLLEFTLGILAAAIFNRQRIPVAGIGATATALLALIVTGLGDRVIYAGLPFALLVLCAAHLNRRASRVSRIEMFFARLGDASYSIFLIQVFIVSAVCKFVPLISPVRSVDGVVALATGATIASGFALYVFVERPLLNLCRSMKRVRAGPVSAQ